MEKRKIHVLIVISMMLMTIFVAFPIKKPVKANPSSGEDLIDIDLDLQFIYNVTQNLSTVIYDAYSDGELEKGRAFGTKGEHYAADYLYDVIVSLLTNI